DVVDAFPFAVEVLPPGGRLLVRLNELDIQRGPHVEKRELRARLCRGALVARLRPGQLIRGMDGRLLHAQEVRIGLRRLFYIVNQDPHLCDHVGAEDFLFHLTPFWKRSKVDAWTPASWSTGSSKAETA